MSDAVDNYQIMSEEQKKKLSEVLAGTHCNSEKSELNKIDDMSVKSANSNLEVKSNVGDGNNSMECRCKKSNFKLSTSYKVGEMLNQLLSHKTTGKTTIKIEIEFSDK